MLSMVSTLGTLLVAARMHALEAAEDEHERLQEEVDRASEAQRDTLHLRGASLLDMEKKLQKSFTGLSIPSKGKRKT